jgi:aminopeptidase-like protein
MRFKSGYEAFSWTVPEKWTPRAAWIKRDGETVCDYADHPLHLMSYSEPFTGRVSRAELLEHLHTDPDRPGAIPYSYAYYQRDWGMSVPYSTYSTLPDGEYEVHIDTSFEPGELKVAEWVIPGDSDRSIIFSAHLDHPAQVSDGLGGVAAGMALFKRIAKMKNRRYTYRLVILPENIGSACYLHHNRDRLDRYEYAVFLEMVTNKGRMSLQQSKRGDTQIDRLAELAITGHEPAYGVGPFRQVICNDEINYDGPGIDIPTVVLTRWPYPEYHTSDDSPAIVSRLHLKKTLEICWDLVGLLERNVYPDRRYQANLMLGPQGLYEDLNADDTVERVMLAFDGEKSILDIATLLDIPFDRAADFAHRFAEKDLVSLENGPTRA